MHLKTIETLCLGILSARKSGICDNGSFVKRLEIITHPEHRWDVQHDLTIHGPLVQKALCLMPNLQIVANVDIPLRNDNTSTFTTFMMHFVKEARCPSLRVWNSANRELANPMCEDWYNTFPHMRSACLPICYPHQQMPPQSCLNNVTMVQYPILAYATPWEHVHFPQLRHVIYIPKIRNSVSFQPFLSSFMSFLQVHNKTIEIVEVVEGHNLDFLATVALPALHTVVLVIRTWYSFLSGGVTLPANVIELGIRVLKSQAPKATMRFVHENIQKLVAPGLQRIVLFGPRDVYNIRVKHSKIFKELVSYTSGKGWQILDGKGTLLT